MTRLQRFCLNLYPLIWRVRYGGELSELVADAKPGVWGTCDLLVSAVRLQLTRQTLGKTIFLWALLGLATGLTASFLVTPRYVSEATLVLDKALPGDDPGASFLHYKTEILSRSYLSGLLSSNKFDLRAKDRLRVQLLDRINELSRDLTIEPLATKSSSSVPFRITFTDSDPHAAQEVVRTIIQSFMSQHVQRTRQQWEESTSPDLVTAMERLQARIEALEQSAGRKMTSEPLPRQTPRYGALEVLDPPILPESPIFPNRISFALTGAGIGLSCGLILFTLRRIRTTPPKQVTA